VRINILLSFAIILYISFIPVINGAAGLNLGKKNVNISSDNYNISEKVIIQFDEEPILIYASKFWNESIKEQNDVNELQNPLRKKDINQSIRKYKEDILNNHSKAKKLIQYNNIQLKIKKEYYNVFNGIAAEIDKDELIKLKKIYNIKLIYPDNNVHISLQESVTEINATKVWNIQNSRAENITGKNVKVAIIDTGIDYMHPDLGGGFGQGYKIISGWDFYNNDSNPMDDNGHGTHVAGIVAANGSIKGVAPDANLLAYKVLGSDGYGVSSDIIAAIEKAVDPDGDPLTTDGADIISISITGEGNPDDPLSQSVNNANDAGVLVVVAAGNSGSKNSIKSPGVAKKALTIGAVDKLDTIAYFSSKGPVIWDNEMLIKPELVAPGVDINSTVPIGTCGLCSNSSYKLLSGTSMATPHISGVAALLKQLYPNWTPEELKSALITTSVDLNYDIFIQGAGRIDAFKAANVDSLVIPSILNLGLVNESINIWKVNTSFEVKNIANISNNYSLIVQMPFSPGILINLSQTFIHLDSNSSEMINISILLNNSVVSGGNFEGIILINSDTMTYRLPFVFIKSIGKITDMYIESGIDLDQNGLYEDISINVGLNINTNGNYVLRGSLYNNSSNIDYNNIVTKLNKGNLFVKFKFNGTKIWKSKDNTSFYVKNLYLYNASDGTQLDYRELAYTTHFYNYTDFRPPSPLSLNITKSPAPIIAGSISQVSAYVSSNGSAVPSARVHLYSSGGILNITDGVTDDAGYFNTTYTAPVVNSTYLICANVSGWHYSNNSKCDSIMVIKDTILPAVTDPSSNQSSLPTDTDNTPLWGESARLNVTVNDNARVNSVTVDLSEIGRARDTVMMNIGGDIYSAVTNASASTPAKLYNLTVNATDASGNSNTSVSIQLKVMKNGDCTGNNFVDIGDALRLSNNVSHPGDPAYGLSNRYVCEVTGNEVVNIGDALRLANNVSYPGISDYILK